MNSWQLTIEYKCNFNFNATKAKINGEREQVNRNERDKENVENNKVLNSVMSSLLLNVIKVVWQQQQLHSCGAQTLKYIVNKHTYTHTDAINA